MSFELKKLLIGGAVSALLVGGLSACDNNDSASSVGEEIDEAVEEVTEGDGPLEKAGEALEEAGDDIEEAVEDANPQNN